MRWPAARGQQLVDAARRRLHLGALRQLAALRHLFVMPTLAALVAERVLKQQRVRVEQSALNLRQLERLGLNERGVARAVLTYRALHC